MVNYSLIYKEEIHHSVYTISKIQHLHIGSYILIILILTFLRIQNFYMSYTYTIFNRYKFQYNVNHAAESFLHKMFSNIIPPKPKKLILIQSQELFQSLKILTYIINQIA